MGGGGGGDGDIINNSAAEVTLHKYASILDPAIPCFGKLESLQMGVVIYMRLLYMGSCL